MTKKQIDILRKAVGMAEYFVDDFVEKNTWANGMSPEKKAQANAYYDIIKASNGILDQFSQGKVER